MSATPRCDPLRELVWTPDGARTPAEEALLQAHLAECADCRAAVAAARRVSASLAELPTVAAPATLRERTLAELDARRTAAAAANGASPAPASVATPRSLDAPRRRSLPIALRMALPVAATLALAVVWWQSRVAELPLLESAAPSAPSGRDDDAKELLAQAPVEKAADPSALDSLEGSVPNPDPAGADRSGLSREAAEREGEGDGPGAAGGAPVAGGRGGVRNRGIGAPSGAPRGAPPPPGAAAAPQPGQSAQEEQPVDPRSAALLAAATPADALQLIERERAARYGSVPELALDEERRKATDHEGAPQPAAPTELRYAEWSPASPREKELLAEWSRRGAREGDLLVIDLAPEELAARRQAESGFVDFGDDDQRVLRQVDDPELWWKAAWRAEEVAKPKSEAKSGDSRSGDAKPGDAGTKDAPAQPTATTGSARGQDKKAPEAAPAETEKADRDDATRHDEEARAAKARRVRVVVRIIAS